MARKRTSSQRKLSNAAIADLCIQSALDIASKDGWKAVSLEKVAIKTKMPVEKIKSLFSDTASLLAHVLKKTDRELTLHVKKNLECSPDTWRDNLFEVVMARFDIIQKNRKAFLSIYNYLKKDIPTASKLLGPMHKSMSLVLELAEMRSSRTHCLEALTLQAIYMMVIGTWAKDLTLDLSKTMATLNKQLDLFEKIIIYTARLKDQNDVKR